MLISKIKNIEPGDIVGGVTLGGAEVMFKVESVSDDFFMVADYNTLMITPKGEMSLRPSPLFGKKDQPSRLNKSAFIMFFTPDDEILHNYKELVSGIALPNKNIIL